MPNGRPRAVSEPDAYSVRLRRLHEAALNTGRPPDRALRSLISASWRRSMEAGVDPDGRVLWRDGDHRAMSSADEVGLADGFHWGERAIGTNGMGTALATRRPVHIFAAEHLVRALHIWSCSAAPIIDPDSGEVLGCVDLSGTMHTLHPATVALVEILTLLALNPQGATADQLSFSISDACSPDRRPPRSPAPTAARCCPGRSPRPSAANVMSSKARSAPTFCSGAPPTTCRIRLAGLGPP